MACRTLPDHQLQQVHPGARVQLELGGAVLEGHVRLIEPTVRARGRKGVLRIALPPQTGLRAGMLLQGRIRG
ncbi:MAG: HlyD family efflux transporter periplasmic adaptor subunit [Inhella sp.]